MAPTRPSKHTSKPTAKAVSKNRPSKPSASGVKKSLPKSTKSVGSADNVGDDEDDESTVTKPFRANRLKPRIRSVPRRIVSDKWTTLSAACQDDIMATVKLAERGVLMSFPNERTKAQAQAATQKLTVILRKKLEKIPVPPTGNSKDARLNREILLEKNAAAEAALEPTLREIAELETELEKEKELLRQDVQHLEKLRKNAKAQEQVRAEKSRVMPRSLRAYQSTSPPPDINLSNDLYDAAASYKPENDRQIRLLVEQFEGHLQTMHSNAGILRDVPDCIWRARTAVEEVLDRIDGNLLEKVAGL